MTFRDRNSCVDLTCYGAPGFTLGRVIDPNGADDDDCVDFLLIDENHLEAGGTNYSRGFDVAHEQVGPLPARYVTRLRGAAT
jgi:hypothetical protein